MAFGFRKRIKIAPGLHLNVSKSGVSVSTGVKGAHVTFGKQGAYLNTGVPGTGIYKRNKLSGITHGQNESDGLGDDMTSRQEGIVDTPKITEQDIDNFRGKKFVLVVETFYPEAYHAVKQQLENELEATTQFLIKKSTDYVVVGTKKELPKMNQNTIDRLNSKGANIQIIKLS